MAFWPVTCKRPVFHYPSVTLAGSLVCGFPVSLTGIPVGGFLASFTGTLAGSPAQSDTSTNFCLPSVGPQPQYLQYGLSPWLSTLENRDGENGSSNLFPKFLGTFPQPQRYWLLPKPLLLCLLVISSLSSHSRFTS